METPNAISIITDKIYGWVEGFIAMLPNLLVATAILVGFYFLAKLVRYGFEKIAHRYTGEKMITSLASKFIMVAIVGLGLFTALSVLHLDKTVTSLLAGAGVIGLALGFAFQDTAANIISGIVLSVRKPIKNGDIVEVADEMGTVEKISLRYTQIESFQGQAIFIPNKDVINDVLINYTTKGKRRIDLPVGVSYGDDLEKVQKLVEETIQNLDGVDTTKENTVYFEGFGSSSINFKARFWIEFPDHPGFLKMRSDAVMAIKKAFDENDITIPFPIRTLDFGAKGGEPVSKVISDLDINWGEKASSSNGSGS